ncbi:hypothetical protein [Corynebacterium sp. CCM 9203]|uniref:hypothetical protein n=1 Tax=Corynebacterium sp. CCM 9203 TaxID=3057615 RepID=UPI00352683DC
MSESSAAMSEKQSTRSPGESPATAFLTTFNEIEGFLRETLGARRSDSFTWMVRQLANRNRLTRTQTDALRSFADLRNAISHGEYRGGRPIADPRPDTIEEIRKLRDVLLAAPTAVAVLKQDRIIGFTPESPVNDVLAAIRDTGFAQFPVYREGNYHRLLTSRSVARWIAHDLGVNGRIDAANVSDILRFAESTDRAELMARTATVPEVLECLGSRDDTGHTPEAVIVTENGHGDQRPLAIVVASDIPTLLDAVSF